MARPFLQKATLSATSFLVTLIALEIALRLYGYHPPAYLRRGTEFAFRPSVYPGLRYELVPGAFVDGSGTDTKINSRGFRGSEPSKDSATQRVIVLGDSITFGNDLALEDTYPFQLQKRLRSEGGNIEVLNFGVPGYDTLQEVSLLGIRGLEFHPDLVVVGYCLNDVSIASVSLEHIQRMTRLRSSPYNFIYESRLLDLMADSIEKLRIKNQEKHLNDPVVFRQQYADQIDPIGDDETALLNLMGQSPTWPSTLRYGERDRVGRLRFGFRRLAQLSKEHGFAVVIVIIPLLFEKNGVYSHAAAHRVVEMESRRAGFQTIDMADAFMSGGFGNLTLSAGDIIHPNKIGHSIIADSLTSFIKQNLKPKPRP